MITLDTSAIVALCTAARSPVRDALEKEPGQRLVPAEILGEVCHMVERRVSRRSFLTFLTDLDAGRFTCESGTAERLPRIRELLDRYTDLRLDFPDAAAAACAEAHGGRVLTLDRRDFDVIAGEGRITVLP